VVFRLIRTRRPQCCWRSVVSTKEISLPFAAFIPVVCKVYYGYDILVRQGVTTVEALYHGLTEAIRGQCIPVDIFPLTWTFDTIVGAFNNFPEARELYHFATAVVPYSLNHGRRVLLSVLFALAANVGMAWRVS